MAKPQLRIVPSRTEIGTVGPPRRKPNAELRTREFLTEPEIERLLKAAKGNRWGPRDAAMILIAYRHGLRAAELVDLRWDQVELGRSAVLHVRRVKNGTPSTHPLQGDEIRALRALMPGGQRNSPFVFVSERDAPFTTAGFAKMVARAGVAAKVSSPSIPTCCATPAATSSPMTATTPEACKPTSGIRTSSIRCATPNWRRPGSRISGARTAVFGRCLIHASHAQQEPICRPPLSP